MPVKPSDFVELNRTFYQVPSEFTQPSHTDDLDFSEIFGLGIDDATNWESLFKEFRIILLSEAGSGKTEEIRNVTLRLRSKGKHAFFLRIENMSSGLEEAFEEGNFEEFGWWLNSNEEGWLLLDSVDESRLKDPKDFENAIKVLSRHLSLKMQTAHIVITGRAYAWRPVTDLAMCEKLLPFTIPNRSQSQIYESDDDSTLEPDSSSSGNIVDEEINRQENSSFKIFSLTDLSADQIRTFVSYN